MNEVVTFLQNNSAGFFATIDNNQPRVRPFQFMFEQDGKLYFCTANNKEVYKQLKQNSNFEFCSSSPSFEWIRVTGKAEFTNDLEIKSKIMEHSPLVKSIYKLPDNPEFEAFYVKDGSAVISSFSGETPNVFNLK